ncbi:MAG: dihydroorotate dehydrogenase electron transfer subunit [Bacillota bacterium]
MYLTAEVTLQEEVAKGIYRLRIFTPTIASLASPGQFGMIRGWEGYDPLLPRPLSFHRIDFQCGQVEFVYKVAGRGTALMSQWRPGHRVALLGPLGNGFHPPAAPAIAVVGRGMGTVPLLPLVESARREGIGVFSFLSASQACGLVDLDRFVGCSDQIFVRTDDGSLGAPGVVSEDLERVAESTRLSAIYCCGSRRLARAARDLAIRLRIPAYVSLEEHMGCGVGACKGCVCETAGGYRKVCKDGPVFELNEVVI